MNANSNRCMTDRKKIALLWLMAAFSVSVAAQPYDRVERRNFWNAGSNVTGLRMDSLTVSYAELYGRYEAGGFRDTHEAARAWSAGAVAKTITHSERYSMTGSFSFDNTSGSDMCGSMFIRPGFYPVDVLEFTPGRKDLQTYAFMGGIAVDVASCWRVGGKMDFAAANYAKRKDLRYMNYRLDMKVAPAVMYHRGDAAVGISYLFGKNSESVKAEEIGTTTAAYYAFLDKGLMYGAYEVWTGSGVHLNETGMDAFPVSELSNGVGVQVQFGNFYGDAEYVGSSGKVGEKETVWFRFARHGISSRLGYRIARGGRSHFLRFRLDWEYLSNNENVLGKETANGVTVTKVYGSNRIFERTWVTANPEYGFTGPRGEFTAGVQVSSLRRMSFQMFPYVMSQNLVQARIYASGIWNVGRFDIGAGAAFAAGGFSDGQLEAATDMEPGEPPFHLERYYDMQNEYMTAPRITVHCSLRYNFLHGMYAEAAASYVRGFRLRFIGGADRWCGTLRIGYTF